MVNELHTACKEGDLEKVKALITNDPSLINQPHSIYGTYPIFFAAQQGHLHIVQYLLSIPSIKTTDPSSAWKNLLFFCCDCKKTIKQSEMLQFIHTNFELCNFEDRFSKLHVAAALGDYDHCSMHKDKLLQFNDKSFPPIFFSLFMNQQKIVELVFSQESDIQQFILAFLKYQKIESLNELSNNIKLMSKPVNKYYLCAIKALSLYTEELERIIHNHNPETLNSLNNKYRQLACLKSFTGDILFFDKKYQEAISLYKEAIAAREKIKEQSNEDKNALDICHRNIANSYMLHGQTLFNNKKYLEAASAFKEATAAHEKIKDQSNNDKNALDIYHRNIANSYNNHGIILYNDKKYSEAVSACKEAIAAREKIKDQSNEDKNALDIDHRNIAISYNNHGNILYNDKKYLEAASAFKEAIAARENIKDQSNEDKNALDICHRNITNSYNQHGKILYNDKKYLEAVSAFKEAIAAHEKIKDQTNRVKNALDIYHRDIAISYMLHGQTLFNDKKYQEAEFAFKESINNTNKIIIKLDNYYIENARCFLRLAQIHSSFNVIPERVVPVKYFQNAITELNNIQIYNESSCFLIREIYENWRNYYIPYSCEWFFAEVARKLFSNIVNGETFEQIFLNFYNNIKKNASPLSETSALRAPLIQLMELLLKFSKSNNLHADNLPLGVKFILANKELFEEKLNELKAMSDPSLTRELEHHPSTMIAIVNKMKTMENNFQQLTSEHQTLKLENQSLRLETLSLKAALLSATSQTTLPSTTHLAPSSIGLENTDLPSTTAVQTTTQMAAVSSSPASTLSSSLNNNNSMWHHKRKYAQDETTDIVSPQSNNTMEEQLQDETTKQKSKKRAVNM